MNRKKTFILLNTLLIASNSFGMWPSMESAKSTAALVATKTCQKTWQMIKENKGYIGATIATAGLVYGGVKAYLSYTGELTPQKTSSQNTAHVNTPQLIMSLQPVEFITLLAQPSASANQNGAMEEQSSETTQASPVETPRMGKSPEEERGTFKAQLAAAHLNSPTTIEEEGSVHDELLPSESTIKVSSAAERKEAFKAQLSTKLAQAASAIIEEEDEEEPTTTQNKDSAISSPSDMQQPAEDDLEAARKEALIKRMARISRAGNPAAHSMARFAAETSNKANM